MCRVEFSLIKSLGLRQGKLIFFFLVDPELLFFKVITHYILEEGKHCCTAHTVWPAMW